MPAFDDAFARVKQLVADFKANEHYFLSPAYQEQEARRDFIDKFWIALGWDVNHDTQKNPCGQEVKVERKEHGHSQRRADYAFYLAPNFRDVKFYVEAKKPHGDIATADNYFQAARYGWSSHTACGGKAEGAQGGRRLLHAGIHRPLPRREHRRQTHRGQNTGADCEWKTR